ncbi:Tol-Pal system subunit TolQ [Alphaproteobacteria bacterium]|nr:Tol-Pal system subunit TolQ [Alphaproteobacteria bacterium]
MTNNSSISVLNLLIQADIIVQIVILALVFASLFSWALIFDKILKFRILKKRSDEFEEYFENGAKIEEVFNKTKNNDNHPLARIFLACIKEWKLNNIKQIMSDGVDKKSALKERLANAMTVATNRSLIKLESGLNYMAIIGSSAPFVGLFGTVWGILNSFQAIAVSKNTSLAVVAPGIAESLLATAIGLFAAIPAVFFYNIFAAKINQFNERASNFSLLLINALSKELDK